MKKCRNCGRENEDAPQNCRECGKEFAEPPLRRLLRIPWRWPGPALRIAAGLLVIVLFYFLSYGPVRRYFVKVTSTATTVNEVYTVTVTEQSPAWVSILYYPAFWLLMTEAGNRTYGAYLRWWERTREAQ